MSIWWLLSSCGSKGTLNRKQVTVTSRLMDMGKADKSQRGRGKGCHYSFGTNQRKRNRGGGKIKKIKSSQTESKKGGKKTTRTKENMFFYLIYRYIILSKKTNKTKQN